MRRTGLLGLLVVILLSGPTAVEARKNPHLPRGVRLLDRAEDEKALEAFRRALKWRGNRRRDLARIHVYLGITHLNLTDEESARSHFRTGLRLNPKIALPEDVSPKIRAFVERIRQALSEKPKPEEKPAAPVTAPPGRATPLVTPVVRRRRTASAWSYWPAWATLSVGVAAGGAGLALGLMARSRADEANDLTLPASDAEEKHDSAGTLALTANILFVAAGASAILSGVLFYVGSGRQVDTAGAGVVPLRGGALVQLRGVRW